MADGNHRKPDCGCPGLVCIPTVFVTHTLVVLVVVWPTHRGYPHAKPDDDVKLDRHRCVGIWSTNVNTSIDITPPPHNPRDSLPTHNLIRSAEHTPYDLVKYWARHTWQIFRHRWGLFLNRQIKRKKITAKRRCP